MRPAPCAVGRMAREGWTAHVSAMAYDRIYARERFTFALRHGDRELTALAGALLASLRAGFRLPD